MHVVHRCGILLQRSHVAWPICLCVPVCLSVCLSHGCAENGLNVAKSPSFGQFLATFSLRACRNGYFDISVKVLTSPFDLSSR